MDITSLLVVLVATVIFYFACAVNAGSDAPAQAIPHPPHMPDHHGGPEGEPGEVAHPHEHGGHEEAPRHHEHVRHDA